MSTEKKDDKTPGQQLAGDQLADLDRAADATVAKKTAPQLAGDKLIADSTREKLDRAADAVADVFDDPEVGDRIEESVNRAVGDAVEPMMLDLFAACALVGTDCRGQEPDTVAKRCYAVGAAMMKHRTELQAAENTPTRTPRN